MSGAIIPDCCCLSPRVLSLLNSRFAGMPAATKTRAAVHLLTGAAFLCILAARPGSCLFVGRVVMFHCLLSPWVLD